MKLLDIQEQENLKTMTSIPPTPSEDVSSWKSNPNFLSWMTSINPSLTREQVRAYGPAKWLGGWCEDFALYFALRWKVPMLFLNREHNLVKIGGLYFDGADLHGKPRLSEMEYVRRWSPELSKKTEEELLSLLEEDWEWREYPPLARHAGEVEEI